MGRLPIENKQPEIARHIAFLLSRNYSDHEVANMISMMNSYKISHKLVGRYRARQEKRKVPCSDTLKRPSSKLPQDWRMCDQCHELGLIYDRKCGEIVCQECGVVRGPIKTRHIDLETQLESYAPERPLGEAHGNGTWMPYQDLQKLGLKKVSWAVYSSVRDASPKDLRRMRRYASKVLEELPSFSSRSNEVVKARKAQCCKATAELLWLIYTRAKNEVENSTVLTDSVIKIDWKDFVPSILEKVLSDFLPSGHIGLRQLKQKYPTNQPLQEKIEKLIAAQLPQESREPEKLMVPIEVKVEEAA